MKMQHTTEMSRQYIEARQKEKEIYNTAIRGFEGKLRYEVANLLAHSYIPAEKYEDDSLLLVRRDMEKLGYAILIRPDGSHENPVWPIERYTKCSVCEGAGLKLNVEGDPDTCPECNGDAVKMKLYEVRSN